MHCFHHICSVERNFTTVEIQFREQQPILHTYSQWGVENAEKTLLIRLSYCGGGVLETFGNLILMLAELRSFHLQYPKKSFSQPSGFFLKTSNQNEEPFSSGISNWPKFTSSFDLISGMKLMPNIKSFLQKNNNSQLSKGVTLAP